MLKNLLKPLEFLKKESFYTKQAPHAVLELLRKYLRVEIEGQENVLLNGSAIVAPNHSGFSGFDAIILNHMLQSLTDREIKTLTHKLWFANPTLGKLASNYGFIPAGYENGIEELKKQQMLVIFPEGEEGNFKPSSQNYELQEFKRGFVKMSLLTKAPIIPTVILGAEETHINLSKIRLGKFLKGNPFPLPLNLVPLPAKWKIRFLEPIYLPYAIDAIKEDQIIHELAEDLRDRMQTAIHRELKKRKYVYLPGI